MKLCVIGLGYIGLPTALLFADKSGIDVVGLDIDESLIEKLNSGDMILEEKGLQNILHKATVTGKFRATLSPEKADVFMITVPTPIKDDNWKTCDLTNVMEALDRIVPLLEPGNIVVVESTIPPKTMENYIKPKIIATGLQIGKDIFVAYCPERVIPGNILHEFTYNNRIIGGLTPPCGKKVATFYGNVVQGKLIETTAEIAEMVKLMENIYRDVNIALANECFKICLELGVNVLEVIEKANEHPRVNIHAPGAGVGGHCLAIDPYFVISQVPNTAHMLQLSREINESMPGFVVDIVMKLMRRIQGNKITIFGVAYKGNIGDIRESPAIAVYNGLRTMNQFTVSVYDPHVDAEFVESNSNKALQDTSLVLILTDHDEFKDLTSDQFLNMPQCVIFDTKHVVKNYPEGMEYIHFGNLYEYIKHTV